MTITFSTDVLQKHNMPVSEFLDRLKGFLGLPPDKALSPMECSSDSSKDLVARILVESSPKLKDSPVSDFEALAQKLQSLYPDGLKPSTTYPWRGSVPEIAQKLRVLVVCHGFLFTEEQAIRATKAYVSQFPDDKTHMRLLKYFLLRTSGDEITSDFMSIIENTKESKGVSRPDAPSGL